MKRTDISAELVEHLRRSGADVGPAELAALADKVRDAIQSEGLNAEDRKHAAQFIADSRSLLVFASAAYGFALALGITCFLVLTVFPHRLAKLTPFPDLPLADVCWLFGMPFGALGIALTWIASSRLKRVLREASLSSNSHAAITDNAER